MRRNTFGRLVGAIALVLGLAFIAFPSAAAASGSGALTSTNTVVAGEDFTASLVCGFSAPGVTAYYNHCGSSSWVGLTVEFWWGGGADREICVPPGITNLSAHPALQGGLITWAYDDHTGCS